VERALAVQPGFAVTTQNAKALVQIASGWMECRWRWARKSVGVLSRVEGDEPVGLH
jgi:hypothetical protein